MKWPQTCWLTFLSSERKFGILVTTIEENVVVDTNGGRGAYVICIDSLTPAAVAAAVLPAQLPGSSCPEAAAPSARPSLFLFLPRAFQWTVI